MASATVAIAGARLAGASTIIGVDIDDRKLEWAKGFGATHVCNSKETDPVEYIRSVTGGFGADVCIEVIGHPEVYKTLDDSHRHTVPHPDAESCALRSPA